MFERYLLEGGIADPCIIAHTPSTGASAGQVRRQYHHAVDILPTVLDICGIPLPEKIGGVPQNRVDGTECHALSARHPEKGRGAGPHLVRRGRGERCPAPRRPGRAGAVRPLAPRPEYAGRYVCKPGTSQVPESVAVDVSGKAEVDLEFQLLLSRD